MPTPKRIKTKYPGIYYRETERIGGTGVEKVFYAVYKKNGKVIETKLGRQYTDDLTAARAAILRSELIEGKRETRKELREAQKKAEGEPVWTVGNLWEEYKRRKPDLKGIVTDQNRFDVHLSSYKELYPEQITSTIIDNLRLSLSKRGLSPGTIRNVLELLRRIISFGLKKGLINPNQIVTHFEMPRLNNERTEDLSPEQLTVLMDVIAKTRYKKAGNMMLLALYTGMRRGEMFNLKWEHIDWDHGFINLLGKEDDLGAKSGQNERISLNEMAHNLLTSIERTPSPYVFPGKKGKRLELIP